MMKSFASWFVRLLYTEFVIEGRHTQTVWHNMCTVVFWTVDMMPDMLTHYHTHSPRRRKVLHKECNITIGNKGLWGNLYLSCSDIYFRRGSSTNIILSQTQTRTHIQRGEFHIFRLNKVIYLPCVMPQLSYSFKVWVTLRIPCRQGNTLHITWQDRRIAILSLSNRSEHTQAKECTQQLDSNGEYLLSKHVNRQHTAILNKVTQH